MCTVTYLPIAQDQFILTSNRDEQADRSPQNITVVHEHGLELAFPRDQGAGGSWVAISSDHRVTCLLNGAFVKHSHQPPYKRSRGLMLLDFFGFTDAGAFFNTYDFEGIEPFTMIIYDRGSLYDFRWDGLNPYPQKLDAGRPHLWSSSTLYTPEVKAKRQKWFADWLAGRTDFSQKDILEFHHRAGDGDPWNDVIMNRDGMVQTVSITSIHKMPNKITMSYEDLLRERVRSVEIEGEEE